MNLFRQWLDTPPNTSPGHSNECDGMAVEICHYDDAGNEKITVRVPLVDFSNAMGMNSASEICGQCSSVSSN